MNHLGKIGTVLGIIAGVLPQIPGVPGYLAYVVGGLSAIALYLAQTPLAPSPTTNDDSGPKVGKASGEAGQAAGKGPFKP